MKPLRYLLFMIIGLIYTTAHAEPETLGYMGMGIDNLPTSLRAYMPKNITDKQGVMVTRFGDSSPAADNGIKKYDVLVAYDNEPIEDPEKLIKRIREDKPGRVVKLRVVRQGEILEIPITLGKQTKKSPVAQPATQAKNIPVMPVFSQRGARQSFPMTANMPRFKSPFASKKFYPSRATPSQPVYQQPIVVGRFGYPMRKKIKIKKHAWGEKRNIWDDFYTDFTGDMWDAMVNAPYDMGRMPGGWRSPSLSTPDPVTVGDAVTNQIPPMVEEMGKMTDFNN